MERNKIRFLPEVELLIDNLPSLLQGLGYKINEEFADKFVDEIVDFIYNIPNLQAHEVNPAFAYHFKRYGDNLKYVFWKRGNTTWYIFFRQIGSRILVCHISNNWTEGQYIR